MPTLAHQHIKSILLGVCPLICFTRNFGVSAYTCMVGRVLEICCTSVEDACAAQSGGADRIELCERLDVGGVTPRKDLVAEVLAQMAVPVFGLIRARAGDFSYGDKEIESMLISIDQLKQLGVGGIVCGALDGGRRVDRDATAAMVAAARPLPVTFHRAFDQCADRIGQLGVLRELGCDRVLTSDGQQLASDGPERMRKLAEAAAGSPMILCCGGVRSSNVGSLAGIQALREFHSAARIEAGGVDAREVRALKMMLAEQP